MRRRWRMDRRAQSTMEVVFLVIVVIAGLIFVQIYLKRGIMGKIRSSADQIGDQFTPLGTRNSYKTVYDVKRTDNVEPTGVSVQEMINPELQVRTGEEHVDWDLDSEKLF